VSWTLLNGDALKMLKTLPDESVHCCVTSPPYWGLRDYGVDGQLGLEQTPEEYVANMVEVFREVRRVLRKDGTLWLNLGDSYATTPTGSYGSKSGLHGAQTSAKYKQTIQEVYTKKSNTVVSGLKPKDLVGIPWRVAFALQADGWWLRSDIIWAKPNPMPESVTDRPTKSHEYIFLLTKSEKYFYNADAIREDSGEWNSAKGFKYEGQSIRNIEGRIGNRENLVQTGRNKRTVWSITTKPYKEAHFATFPPEIPETCIKAGTSEKGCCPKCGSPWERTIERTGHINKREPAHAPNNCPTKTDSTGWAPTTRATDKWQPTCSCGIEETIPCTALDPFAGAGTTLWVAEQLGVNSIGIELNPDYCEIIEKRMNGIELDLFAMEGSK
jgi:DNA modification methylase